jgi:hypothetical protein
MIGLQPAIPKSRFGFPCVPRPAQCPTNLAVTPPPLRPEPNIYSPAYEYAQGVPPTWNSPDLQIYPNPVYASGQWALPSPFLSNPVATISNSSSVAAVNTTVTISYGGVGIGYPKTTLQTQTVTIPGSSAIQVSVPLSAAVQVYLASGTSIAMYVDLAHPYDSNINDNHGVNNAPIFLGAPVGGLFLDLYNSTNANLAFNSQIVGPNTIGATLPAATMVVPPGAPALLPIDVNFDAQPAGSNSAITVIALDDGGDLIGGCTLRLYF